MPAFFDDVDPAWKSAENAAWNAAAHASEQRGDTQEEFDRAWRSAYDAAARRYERLNKA